MAKANYVGEGKTIADYPAGSSINLPGQPLKRDWLHCNAVDYNAEVGQVVTEFGARRDLRDRTRQDLHRGRSAGEHQGGGEAGRRFPLPFRRSGTLRSGRSAANPGELGLLDLRRQADRRLPRRTGSAPGCPAGHLVVFNNGQYLFDRTSQSSIVEINRFSTIEDRLGPLRQSRRMPDTRRSVSMPIRTSRRSECRNRSSGATSPRPIRVFQPHRLGLRSDRQREHADLLRHHRPSLRGDARRMAWEYINPVRAVGDG